MNDIGVDRLQAFSAGATLKGQLSPITLKVLQETFRIDALEQEASRQRRS